MKGASSTDLTPTSSSSMAKKAPEGGERHPTSVSERKREEWEKIEELQRQLLAAHQRMARLDFEQSTAAVVSASRLPSTSSSATPPTPLPGAKGRKKK